jgi:hypothetical protein
MPDPPTWSGFLGARLNGLEKPLVLLRVVVAMQHVSHQKIPLANGEGAGQAFKRAKAMALPELLTFAETLGVYLDTDPQPATAKTHDGD